MACQLVCKSAKTTCTDDAASRWQVAVSCLSQLTATQLVETCIACRMHAQLHSEMQFLKVTTFVPNFFSLPVLRREGKKVQQRSDRPYMYRVGVAGRCQPTLKNLTFLINDLPNISIFWLLDEGTHWVAATRNLYVTTVPYPLTRHLFAID